MTKKSYSIIWKHFKKDSDIGVRLKAQDRFSLPYFVDGIDKVNFEKKLPTSLNPLHLIKGLLVGYFDKPSGADTTFAKQKTKKILTDHLEMFKSESLENLILDFAAHLREQNGHEASLQALMTGTELVSDSSNIKYDCSLDLYNCINDDILKDRGSAIQKLIELLNGIDTSKINHELLDDYKLMKSDVEKLR